jgi:RNA polymerase sigma factor (sigma-70 family)
MWAQMNTEEAGPADAALVEAARAGDQHAFNRLVERYQTLVCSVAYSATGSVARSEEVGQDAFLAAWRGLAGLADPQRFRAWICGIARNLGRHARRRTSEVLAGTAVDAEMTGGVDPPPPSALEQMIDRQEQAALWSALAQIPEPYREPLVLYYREEQSAERVAEMLDLTAETVRQRLARGRRLLHQAIEENLARSLRRSRPGKGFAVAVAAAVAGIAVTPASAAPARPQGRGLGSALAVAAVVGGAIGGGWLVHGARQAGGRRRTRAPSPQSRPSYRACVQRGPRPRHGRCAPLASFATRAAALSRARSWPSRPSSA